VEQGTVCSVSILFRPRRSGTLNATLDIQSNAGFQSIPLSGFAPRAGFYRAPSAAESGLEVGHARTNIDVL
jgi:hypothetical protein